MKAAQSRKGRCAPRRIAGGGEWLLDRRATSETIHRHKHGPYFVLSVKSGEICQDSQQRFAIGQEVKDADGVRFAAPGYPDVILNQDSTIAQF
jgi:hypothetical protein